MMTGNYPFLWYPCQDLFLKLISPHKIEKGPFHIYDKNL